MTDKDQTRKPFWENIVEKKKRHPKPSKKDSSGGERSDSRDSARPSRDRPDSRGGERGDRPRYVKEDFRKGGGDRDFASSSRKSRSFDAPEKGVPVFGDLLPETKSLLESFPELVQSVTPLDSKKLQELPERIRELSHELTDERSERRVGYLNDPAILSAYVRYYQWWNLVRLTKIFARLPLELNDGDIAADLGSGPLTLPIALWMARPDLRDKKITWYCVDISQGALSLGEELFLSLAAKTGNEPWKIVRVRGEFGVSLRRRVALVACANMFNERFWDSPQPIEAQAKHDASDIAAYADERSSILVVEPGVPRGGRFITLLRDSLARLGFVPLSPCPHANECPLPGLRFGKWCHFVFDTSDAPAALHKLSDSAGLSKDRAALSYIFSRRDPAAKDSSAEDADGAAEAADATPAPSAEGESHLSVVNRLSGLFASLDVRVTSDPIRLPEYRTGRYGCSEMGMVLLVGKYEAGDWLKTCVSGSFIKVPRPDGRKLERDEKTGALLITL